VTEPQSRFTASARCFFFTSLAFGLLFYVSLSSILISILSVKIEISGMEELQRRGYSFGVWKESALDDALKVKQYYGNGHSSGECPAPKRKIQFRGCVKSVKMNLLFTFSYSRPGLFRRGHRLLWFNPNTGHSWQRKRGRLKWSPRRNLHSSADNSCTLRMRTLLRKLEDAKQWSSLPCMGRSDGGASLYPGTHHLRITSILGRNCWTYQLFLLSQSKLEIN